MADEVGQAPLPAAVRRGDSKAVQALLAAGVEVDAVFTPPVEGKVAPLLAGYTSLMIAAADGDTGLVRDLLAAGADVNTVVDGAAVRRVARPEVKVLEEGRPTACTVPARRWNLSAMVLASTTSPTRPGARPRKARAPPGSVSAPGCAGWTSRRSILSHCRRAPAEPGRLRPRSGPRALRARRP